MFQRFTDDARHVVVSAQDEARARNHNYIGSEHLLLALVRDRDSTAARALEDVAVDLDDVRAQIDHAIGTGGHSPSGHILFTPSAKKTLELALREALYLGDNFIGTEHILLGLVHDGQGVAASVLMTYGVDLERARAAVLSVRGGKRAVARGSTSRTLQTWRRPPVASARLEPRCALCGRDEARSERVLVSGAIRLCSDCARSAVAQLDALPADAPKLVRYRRTEVAPSDRDAAVAAIEQAFEAVLGPMHLPIADAVAFTEGGDECRTFLETIRAAREHAPFTVNDQTVERVRFVDEDAAEVSVGIWFVGSSQPTIWPAHAVLEDGRWKVSRSTLEQTAQQARAFLPGPPAP